jgi:hypothetical protein
MSDLHDTTHLKSSCNCMHPIKVYNKYIDEYMYVPCRKCLACQNSYALNLQTRIEKECKQHVYSFFFTLTYDNQHLPMFRLVDDCPFISEPCFMSNRLADLPLSFFDYTHDYPQAAKQFYKGFGYCCKSDVQKFLKRLRINISRSKYLTENETKQNCKIRYFIASEYGPRTFRPHYHGIIWTDSKFVANRMQSLIFKSWSLCSRQRIDIQLVNGSAPQYVAKYVNGNTNLPKVLQLKPTRTFHLASKNPVLGDFKVNDETLRAMLLDGLVRESVPNCETQSIDNVPISNSYFNKWFPKCQGFGIKSHSDKLSILDRYFNFMSNRCAASDHDVKFIYGKLLTIFNYDVPYQDKRFAKMAWYWCHRFNLTTDDYLSCIETLYSNRMLALMSDDYQLQEDYITKYNSPLKSLKFYPLLVNGLPLQLGRFDYFHSDLCSSLTSLGIHYHDLYRDGYLIDLSNIIHDGDDAYNDDMAVKIQHDGLKNKVLNESLSGLFKDY